MILIKIIKANFNYFYGYFNQTEKYQTFNNEIENEIWNPYYHLNYFYLSLFLNYYFIYFISTFEIIINFYQFSSNFRLNDLMTYLFALYHSLMYSNFYLVSKYFLCLMYIVDFQLILILYVHPNNYYIYNLLYF